MAKEILVGELLTAEMINAGERLLEDAKDSDLNIVATFWLYYQEAGEWRLVLVSPRLDRDGPKRLYDELASKLYNEAERRYGIELSNTSFLSPSDTLVQAIASAHSMSGWGSSGLSGKRMSRTRLNGVYVEDIYIYFISDAVKPMLGPKMISK